jgi:dihydroneopterin aldolase
MTAMLASVRSAAEAEVAVARGADLIDAIDTSPAQVASIVAAVQGRCGTSALAGDPAAEPGVVVANVRSLFDAGVDRVRVALLDSEGRQMTVVDTLAGAVDASRLIGIVFADRQEPLPIVPRLAAAGFGGVMLDLVDKPRGRLLAHAGFATLSDFVRAAHGVRVSVGLAGGLEAPDVARLLPLNPEFLGFRGALCVGGDRLADIDAEAVASIRRLIPSEMSDAAPGTEERPISARGSHSEPADNGTLRLFVRDYVLPVRIGAYSHERAGSQKVRFDVTVEVPRGRGEPRDMSDVFSYDIITDAIARVAAAEHVDFAETLAERIAAAILRHPMVRRIAVKVEKLELGPGAVGVELVMDRAGAGVFGRKRDE